MTYAAFAKMQEQNIPAPGSLLAGINSRCGMRGALRKHLEGAFSTWRNPLLTKTRRDGYPERRWTKLAAEFVRYVARVCVKHLSFHSSVPPSTMLQYSPFENLHSQIATA